MITERNGADIREVTAKLITGDTDIYIAPLSENEETKKTIPSSEQKKAYSVFWTDNDLAIVKQMASNNNMNVSKYLLKLVYAERLRSNEKEAQQNMFTGNRDDVKEMTKKYLNGTVEGAITIAPLSDTEDTEAKETKPNGRGRKKAAPEEKKTNYSLYLTDADGVLAKQMAAKNGMSLTEYIIKLIYEDRMRELGLERPIQNGVSFN